MIKISKSIETKYLGMRRSIVDMITLQIELTVILFDYLGKHLQALLDTKPNHMILLPEGRWFFV